MVWIKVFSISLMVEPDIMFLKLSPLLYLGYRVQ
jgi:hypothetical protein